MATIRIEKSSNYTVLSNHHLDDPRLSLKAVGLLSYMLRQPDGWDFTVEWLAGRHKDGSRAVRSALEELESAGYVLRRRTHQEDGTFGPNDYVVREIPAPSTGKPSMAEGSAAAVPPSIPEVPSAEKPSMVPSCQNSTMVPSCQNATMQNATMQNGTQANTITPSTNPPIVPPEGEQPSGTSQRRTTREPKQTAAWKPERFEAFWRYYPAIPDGNGHGRRPKKDRAIAAWDRLKPDDKTINRMAIALKHQKASRQWMDGIGIPYASTWLNSHAWEEEYETLAQPAPVHTEQNGGYELWT